MIRKVSDSSEATDCDNCGSLIEPFEPSWHDEQSAMVGCCRACCLSAAKRADSIRHTQADDRVLADRYACLAGE